MLLLKLIDANKIDEIRQFADSRSFNDEELLWGLFTAVEQGNIEIVKILISSGVDVNQERLLRCQNNLILVEGTVLLSAAVEGNVNIIKILLDAGAEVNAVPRNPDEPSALMLAAQEGYLEVVKILVDAGADVNLIREGNTYALLSAAGNGYKDIFDYLYPLTNLELQQEALIVLPEGIRTKQIAEKADPLVIELTDAVVEQNIDRIYKIINKGVNINGFDDTGSTALLAASAINNYQIVKMLIEVGANPNIKDLENNETPLMRTRCKNISSLLIAARANINAQDIDGNSALSLAKERGNTEIVQLLLDAGAKED